jgi:hypothetical protein
MEQSAGDDAHSAFVSEGFDKCCRVFLRIACGERPCSHAKGGVIFVYEGGGEAGWKAMGSLEAASNLGVEAFDVGRGEWCVAESVRYAGLYGGADDVLFLLRGGE